MLSYLSLLLLAGVGLVFGNFFGAFVVPGMEALPTFKQRKDVRVEEKKAMNIRMGLTPDGETPQADNDGQRRRDALENGGGI